MHINEHHQIEQGAQHRPPSDYGQTPAYQEYAARVADLTASTDWMLWVANPPDVNGTTPDISPTQARDNVAQAIHAHGIAVAPETYSHFDFEPDAIDPELKWLLPKLEEFTRFGFGRRDAAGQALFDKISALGTMMDIEVADRKPSSQFWRDAGSFLLGATLIGKVKNQLEVNNTRLLLGQFFGIGSVEPPE